MPEVTIHENRTIQVDSWLERYAFAGRISEYDRIGYWYGAENKLVCYAEFTTADGECRFFEFIFPAAVTGYADYKQYLYRELEREILKYQWVKN